VASYGSSAVEVSYIGGKGTIQLRMVANDSTDMVETAKALNAMYFIAVDGWDHTANLPIWGVFEPRTANKVMGGTWSLRDPIRTFVTETSDAAVMWALAKVANHG
jgi:hypothetical protein